MGVLFCLLAMRKIVCIACLVFVTGFLFACQTEERDKIGAAGKAEEMADSTRLDSSIDAQNRAGGQPGNTHDTI